MNSHNMRHMDYIETVTTLDIACLEQKEATYKGSWKKRGGVGAFMMLARKWDRIESILSANSYNIFEQAREDGYSGDDGAILAEIRDLRRYLILVEAEIMSQQHDETVDLPSACAERRFRKEKAPHLDTAIPASTQSIVESVPLTTQPPESWQFGRRQYETKHYTRVKEFMKQAGQETPEQVTLPGSNVRELRAKLIMEETLETIDALGVSIHVSHSGPLAFDMLTFETDLSVEPDLVGVADGCADISVVTIGTLVAFGVKDQPLLEEVDRANLRKFIKQGCPNCGKSYDDCVSFTQIRNVSSDVELRIPAGNLTCSVCGVVWPSGYRSAEGKWIKPSDFRPPDIQSVLDKQSKKGVS